MHEDLKEEEPSIHQDPAHEIEPSRDTEPGESLEAWKDELRRVFEASLESVTAIPDETTAEPGDTPDLYSIYEQLATSNAENKRANRRTVEAFSQWGETLSRFDSDLSQLREHLARLPSNEGETLPHGWCLALAEVLDRAQRVLTAFRCPPKSSWFGGTEPWKNAWTLQSQGMDILTSHLQELLAKAGVNKLETLNKPFDPGTMSAVATELQPQLPHHTVVEEVTPGYLRDGQLLRVAQVKISTQKPTLL